MKTTGGVKEWSPETLRSTTILTPGTKLESSISFTYLSVHCC